MHARGWKLKKNGFGTGLVKAMVTDYPIHDLLSGNIPVVSSLINLAQTEFSVIVMTRAQAKKQAQTIKPLKAANPDSLLVDRHKLIELQKDDGDISKLYDLTEPRKKGNQTTRFYTEKDLLYREYMSPYVNMGQSMVQVVAPTSLRVEVMQLAHSSLTGGHLGTQKIRDRILSECFWLGMNSDISQFFQPCDL